MNLDRRSFLRGLAAASLAVALPVKLAAQWVRSRFVNVQAFGARGDGVTDDTAAIAAAFNAVSPGGTVYFPPGDYCVKTAIDFSSGAAVTGFPRADV